MKSLIAVVMALSLISTASASVVQTCPSPDICYSLSIPSTTATSGNGDIYFQLSGPTTYEYIALGQGSQMRGANMFVMYTSTSGTNVTVSPRLGVGYVEPQHDTGANINLMEGSGVTNGVMTANVRCSNCHGWSGGSMDFSSGSAEWIWAIRSGSALGSDDLGEGIGMHDRASSFIFDLSQARGGSADVNPFGPSSSNGPSTSDTGSSSSSSSGSDSSFSSSSTSTIALAHGVLASLAFIALFPFGGILIRLASFPGLIWVHTALQTLAFVTYIAAFGMGVWLATQYRIIHTAHPIIGIVLLALLVGQPVSGWLHHRLFKKYEHRTLWSYVHVWQGRAAVVLGMVNGGLGLALARTSRGAVIAYAVVAGVVGGVYIAVAVVGEARRKRNDQSLRYEKSQRRRGENVRDREEYGQVSPESGSSRR